MTGSGTQLVQMFKWVNWCKLCDEQNPSRERSLTSHQTTGKLKNHRLKIFKGCRLGKGYVSFLQGILFHGNLRGPQCHPPKALLRDYDHHHCPLIRPAISWGGFHWGGPLRFPWLFNILNYLTVAGLNTSISISSILFTMVSLHVICFLFVFKQKDVGFTAWNRGFFKPQRKGDLATKIGSSILS